MIGRGEFLQAALKAIEQLLSIIGSRVRRWSYGRGRTGPSGNGKFFKTQLAMFGVAHILEENKFRGDIAVVRGREAGDLSFFLKFLRHPGQRLIRQFAGRETVFAIEVSNQPAVYLQVFLAAGVDTLIQPMKKIPKRSLSGGPILFQFWPLDTPATILHRVIVRRPNQRCLPLASSERKHHLQINAPVG